ncbi:hypothetical protein [Spirosoma endophyticum]|uniref:Long-chain fatty acid transport protein n=1 Tax=Spirosoma endophyticum TaxID=662367 RepID=A0A1I1PB33_9BACT|nr:hypothetical protein [Spirosoma endophyticum]SFD07094.1 hypothetical protein SAMN05216167_103199 [Spirosoma endophyticum]
MLRAAALLLFIKLSFQEAIAQDSNYWSSNYGPGGFMTPGTTIADTRDSGVFFYNPALLAIRPKTALEFSGSLYQLESTRIIDALGKGKDLRSVSGGVSPQIHSGSLRMKKNERLVMAYALIHTHILSDRVNQRQDAKMNVLNDAYSPGAENYLGQFSSINQVNEIAVALSVGYKLSKKFCIGASFEAQLRTKSFDIEYSGRALSNPLSGAEPLLLPEFSNTESIYRVTYTQVGVKPKLGLAYNQNRHHLGLLVTLPLMRVFGQGSLMTDYVITNIRLAPTLAPLNFLANTRQEKLPTNYKTPLSIAGGYTYDYGRGQLYVATEYFAKINDYNIITPRNDYFIRSDSGSASTTGNLLKLKDVRKAIMNIAVGISFPVKPSVIGYISMRTDFSYTDKKSFVDDEGYVAYTTNWNTYHTQIGINIRRPKFSFRPGLLLSYGFTDKYRSEVNFDTPNESNVLLGNPVDAKVNHFVVGLLLSYIHNL